MSMLTKLGKKLENHVPMIASLLGGPVAGQVGEMVMSVLGVKDEDAAVKALEAQPDLLLKLKQYEMDHAFELEKLGLEAVRLQLADVQSARAREISISQTTKTRDWNMIGLTWITVSGFFTIITVLMTCQVPKTAEAILYILIGVLAAITKDIYGYYFGSSQGSTEKSKTIENSLIKGEEKK